MKKKDMEKLRFYQKKTILEYIATLLIGGSPFSWKPLRMIHAYLLEIVFPISTKNAFSLKPTKAKAKRILPLSIQKD